MNNSDINGILSKYLNLESISDFYNQIHEREMSDDDTDLFLARLVREYKDIIEIEEHYRDKISGEEFKLITRTRGKRKVYITRIAKQIAFRWLDRRDSNDGARNKKYKPRFLKEKLSELTEGILTDVHLTNILWQVRTTHRRNKLENSPLNISRLKVIKLFY